MFGLNLAHRASTNSHQLGGARSLQAAKATSALTVGNIKLCYASYTHAGCDAVGEDKHNQDCWVVGTWSAGDLEDAHGKATEPAVLLGVLDGHGDYGSEAAAVAARVLPQALADSEAFRADDGVQGLQSAFSVAEAEVHGQSHLDSSISGTTAVMALIQGDVLTVANVGDSRCILGRFEGMNDVIAHEFTNDHTPALLAEATRVLAAGGRIAPLELMGKPVGFPRVWERSAPRPGLCVTRSLGDALAKRVGVSAVPEVVSVPVTLDDRYLLLVSDGVTEYISSQALVDMVHEMASRGTHPDAVARAIVREARSRWQEHGAHIDDCTAVVAYLVYDPEGVATQEVRHSLMRRVHAWRRNASGAGNLLGLRLWPAPLWARKIKAWAKGAAGHSVHPRSGSRVSWVKKRTSFTV